MVVYFQNNAFHQVGDGLTIVEDSARIKIPALFERLRPPSSLPFQAFAELDSAMKEPFTVSNATFRNPIVNTGVKIVDRANARKFHTRF